MATTSISQMITAATVDNGDLFEVAHPDSGSQTGYSSNKQSLAAIADHMAGSVNYPALSTTAKTLIASINEALSNFAPAYSNAATYYEGDITLYAGTMYQANQNISTPEDFNSNHWNAVYASQVGGGSGSNEHDYSETEKVVGTWIDGKPLYEKTIDFGYLPNTNTTTVNHGISHLKRVVSFDAGGMNTSGVFLPIPKVSPQGLQYCVDIAVTDSQVLVTTGNDRSGYYAYVTLRYTKTSD